MTGSQTQVPSFMHYKQRRMRHYTAVLEEGDDKLEKQMLVLYGLLSLTYLVVLMLALWLFVKMGMTSQTGLIELLAFILAMVVLLRVSPLLFASLQATKSARDTLRTIRLIQSIKDKSTKGC